jgi:hypothetical protein
MKHALVGLVLAASLSGCVVEPARVRFVSPVVVMAPPVAVVETYGAPPVAGYFWIGGYWGWEGGRHVWVPGRWSAPRAGYRWVPHEWAHEGGGWRLREGYWARR